MDNEQTGARIAANELAMASDSLRAYYVLRGRN